MKKLLFLVTLVFSLNAKAQYVTIPDTAFVNYLQQYHPNCMSGNQMDTTCTDVINSVGENLMNRGIYDLTGIQYFKHLKFLSFSLNHVSVFPNLSNSILQLDCSSNQLNSLSNLPDSLNYLRCEQNLLTNLPTLPDSLKTLYCGYNQLSYLPNLPAALCSLRCEHNSLSNLPTLPNTLVQLECSQNSISNIPILPNSIHLLYCALNLIANLPVLPSSIISLDCYGNQIVALPQLPNSIKYLSCSFNQLTALPSLGDSLIILTCWNNMLVNLPPLPNTLKILRCNNNQIANLPTLPLSLKSLWCNFNQLTSLPTLPNNLVDLICSNNQISCFPTFPSNLDSVAWDMHCDISNNPFTCLPNYVPAMDSISLTYPICVQGDFINNPLNCPSSILILGNTYGDVNANCSLDSLDYMRTNIPIELVDTLNNLLGLVYSSGNATYNFSINSGTYIVKLDTVAKPYTVTCTPGIDTTVTNTTNNPLVSNIDFAIACKPGFDVGVQSIMHTGFVFPGQQHNLQFILGDLSQWYQLNCAAGISGQVQITVNGPLTFNGITASAFTPTVSGNVYTYNISDFGNVNFQQAFGLKFYTDTTAQSGDYIYVNVYVTPVNGDNNPINNSYTYYYQVVNSLDPNLKEVFPTNVSPLYNDWFTYTIHFQNTGNAPAMNIRLLDTLSNNLDLNTFEVTNYSHYNKIYLNGNVLTVSFSNIQLPDSLSDPIGSQGFVQYRIKSKPNLPIGTQIKNTAYIYFDYNAPVVTNTAVSEFTPLSIQKIKTAQLQVYPNPSNGRFTINTNQNQSCQITITNVLGETVFATVSTSKNVEVDLSKQTKGVYFITLRNKDFFGCEKVVVE